MSSLDHVRVRVNGLLTDMESLLMVHLMSPVVETPIWMPPGGGVQFGESLKEALYREMLEETGLKVTVDELWYLHEIHTSRIHAIEFYFLCDLLGGILKTGGDPEYSEKEQIISEVRYMPFEQLNREDVYPGFLREGFIRDYKSDHKISPKFI